MMGIAVLGETLTQQHIIGTGLILIALLVIDGRLFSWSGK